MPSIPSTIPDQSGQPVGPGDQVRILDISPDPDMDEEERELFLEMVGSVCEVERVDEAGCAWVTVWWATSEGSIATSAALEPAQMQKMPRL